MGLGLTARILMFFCFTIFLITPVLAIDETQVVESFQKAINEHFTSYDTDGRERVAQLGGGWVKERFKPMENYKVDVQRTNSLVSPYIAICEFTLVRAMTKFHKLKIDAENDNSFIKSDSRIHKHTYAYQNGKWVVTDRKNKGRQDWYDCNEVVSTVENAGAANIHGCWEKGM